MDFFICSKMQVHKIFLIKLYFNATGMSYVIEKLGVRGGFHDRGCEREIEWEKMY